MSRLLFRIVTVAERSAEGSWLAAAAIIARTVHRRGRTSPALERFLLLIEFAAKHFGRHLVDAPSPDSFEDRLVHQVDDPSLGSLLSLLIASSTPEVLDEMLPQEMDERILHGWFSQNSDAVLKLGVELSGAITSALIPVLRRPEAQAFVREMADEQFDHLGFLTDKEIPPEIGLAILASLKASLCNFAICDVVMTGTRLEAWKEALLLHSWVTYQRHYLRLLASEPSTQVPEHLVPLDQRYDLRELEARSRRFDEAVAGVVDELKPKLE